MRRSSHLILITSSVTPLLQSPDGLRRWAGQPKICSASFLLIWGNGYVWWLSINITSTWVSEREVDSEELKGPLSCPVRESQPFFGTYCAPKAILTRCIVQVPITRPRNTDALPSLIWVSYRVANGPVIQPPGGIMRVCPSKTFIVAGADEVVSESAVRMIYLACVEDSLSPPIFVILEFGWVDRSNTIEWVYEDEVSFLFLICSLGRSICPGCDAFGGLQLIYQMAVVFVSWISAEVCIVIHRL